MSTSTVTPIGNSAAAFHHREARFRSVFENASDAIFIVDPDRDRIVDVNSRACLVTEYQRDELLQTPVSRLHPDEMERLVMFAERARASEPVFDDNLRCRTKSGRFVPVALSATRTKVEQIDYLIVVARALQDRHMEWERKAAFEKVRRLKGELERERDCLREEVRSDINGGLIVGRSPALMQVLRRIEVVAETTASVLIQGESGVGKELIARAVHEMSPRRGGPLVKANCAAIPRELFESEFFGHVRGSFTGAHRDRIGRCQLADRGTLFLDEVAEIPLDLQAKMLRFLQENEFERVGEATTQKVDIRIVAASNRNLLEEVRQQRFREDLYYRLSVFPIEVPPLRERVEDVVPLANYLIQRACMEFGRQPLRLSERQARLLQNYEWPGNVRELRNVIERSVILSRSGTLELEHALLRGSGILRFRQVDTALRAGRSWMTEEEIRGLVRDNLLAALNASDWQVAGADGAAERLGIKPTTLRDRMKSLGIVPPG